MRSVSLTTIGSLIVSKKWPEEDKVEHKLSRLYRGYEGNKDFFEAFSCYSYWQRGRVH